MFAKKSYRRFCCKRPNDALHLTSAAGRRSCNRRAFHPSHSCYGGRVWPLSLTAAHSLGDGIWTWPSIWLSERVGGMYRFRMSGV